VLPTFDDNKIVEEVDLDGKCPPNQSYVAEWMLHTLGDDDPEAFLRAMHKLGVPVASSKLTPQELCVMADEGSFGCSAEHVIHHYLLSKGLNILPSDKKMRMLGNGAIKPSTENKNK